MASITQILKATETTGSLFNHPGSKLVSIFLSDHAGGTWKLQKQNPDGDWVDLDGGLGVEFDSEGEQFFYGTPLLFYRLTGGSVGAKAWLLIADYAPGVGSG